MSITRKTRAKIASVLTLALASIGLVACAPGDGATSSKAKNDSSVTVGVSGSISTLNPAKEAGILNYYIAAVSSEGLLAVDSSGTIVPALAESWEQVSASSYVFNIRQDAKFQDGTTMTVDDVLFSIDVARDPERSPSTAVYWPEGVSVEKTGDWQITINLPAPSVSFPWTVTSNGGLWVTSKAYYEAAGSYGSSKDLVLGTSAYRVKEFKPDSRVVFERVDTWWGGTPEVEKLVVEFFSDENTRLLAQQSGKIDLAVNVASAQLSKWKAMKNVDVITQVDRSYIGFMIDQNVEPFGDEHVRKAIAYSYDSSSVVNSILQGQARVATSIEPAEQLGSAIGVEPASALISKVPHFEFNLEKAKEELAQSSVPGGFTATLSYPSSNQQMGQAAQNLSQNLKKIGINLEVVEQPVETWISELGTGKGLQYMWYTPTTGDPGEISGWLLGASNPANYHNEEVTSLLTQANGQTDPAVRAQNITDATSISTGAAIHIPAWWGESNTVFSSRLKANTEVTSYFFMTPWAASLKLS